MTAMTKNPIQTEHSKKSEVKIKKRNQNGRLHSEFGPT